jgi:nitrilase
MSRTPFSSPAASSPFLVAAVQESPVFLDREATIEKACRIVGEAAGRGARLIVFPEAFVPGYPVWIWQVPPGETHELRRLYAKLVAQSVSVPGPDTARLCEAARRHGVTLAIGINERNDEASGASLYNSLLWIGPDGSILGCHRKLVPTAGERLVHAQGDGSTLAVHPLDIGRASALICWENYMPLARYALYSWGAQIHVAPTWDRGEPWLSTMRHIAKEGRVYVIGSGSAMRRDDLPDGIPAPKSEWINPGDSVIVNPDGKLVAGPLHEEQAILYAEVDPAQFVGPRWQLDVAGHYARPDVFQLVIQRARRPVVTEVAGLSLPSTLSEAEALSDLGVND